MSDFLTKIIVHKRLEVARIMVAEPVELLRGRSEELPDPLDFVAALQLPGKTNKLALIAEIKKASPSKGLIAPDFDVEKIARAYAEAGANVMSVLTDEKFFQGHLSYMQMAKTAAGGKIPVLRKDFIIDEYQVIQARAYGADAILLIMAALDNVTAKNLLELATGLNLRVLVEVHNEEELERALAIGAQVIGINNRNLHTFEVDLKTTERLLAKMPQNIITVSESGLGTRQDIVWLQSLGVKAALIGETFMRAATTPQGLDTAAIGRKIWEMFGE